VVTYGAFGSIKNDAFAIPVEPDVKVGLFEKLNSLFLTL
jgi:hypothetical protein